MKLISFSGIAATLLVQEVSSASNLRLEQQQTLPFESSESLSRELQPGSCNQFCSDPTLCCSQFGFCGQGIEYCDGTNPVSPGVPCGGGFSGNGICSDSTLCCSQYGYCGTGSDYCDGTNPLPDTTPCGGGIIGNGVCSDSSLCCSQYGWCGTAAEYCDNTNPVFENITPETTPCGGGEIGNGFCADSSLCCSQYGYCGTGGEYCDGTNPVPDTPCGGGVFGNQVCADTSLCCSQYGWCGTGSEYCSGGPTPPGPTPTPAPIPLSPVGPIEPLPSDNSRVIAYLGGWTACPTDQQIEQYTHIMLAFAVSYTYNPGKNTCSTTCAIPTPPVCENVPRPDLIQKWRSMGKKIILSFGGAGMGGSWDGNNDCWEYCFGRETQVIDRLTAIYGELGIDGVDIDYEYYYDDFQNGSGFTKGAQAQFFLTEVTQGLRQSLPSGAEVTHAPMDSDMVPGKGYYNVIKNVADSLDFLMPQYYNGITFPGSNFGGALSHFENLRDDVFGGDASKIVFGFCITECSSWNLGGTQAASVMAQLSQASPCNGGAFFWMASYDGAGAWSAPVRNQIQSDSDSAQCGVVEEPEEPQDPCVDAGTKFEIDINGKIKKKNCKWVKRKKERQQKRLCSKDVTPINGTTKKLYKICKETCGLVGKGECKYLKDS